MKVLSIMFSEFLGLVRGDYAPVSARLSKLPTKLALAVAEGHLNLNGVAQVFTLK